MGEVDFGTHCRLVYNFSELPFSEMCLVRRHGLRWQHVGFPLPTVLVLDNSLEGCHNATEGYQCTSRPSSLPTR